MNAKLCERVTLRYCPEKDRLWVQIAAGSEHRVFYVTARFINALVRQWFSHPQCQVSETQWEVQSRKVLNEAKTAKYPATSTGNKEVREEPPLLNTSKLRFEADRTILQFETLDGKIWVLPLQLADSVRFLRALRQQCLIAQWSLHAWPSWLKTLDPIESEPATVAIH